MSLLMYLALGLALTWLIYMAYAWLASQSIKGRPISELDKLPQLADHQTGPLLLYWYSPNCGPCRQMSPIIDTLIAEQQPVHKINIAERPDSARSIGVRAAPTLMRIQDGVVDEVLLGLQKRERILSLLAQD